jgi:hypothetical protein
MRNLAFFKAIDFLDDISHDLTMIRKQEKITRWENEEIKSQ